MHDWWNRMRTKLDTYITQPIVWGLRAVEYVFWCIIREESNTSRGRVGKIQLKSQSANMEGTWLKPFQKSSLLLQLQICIISKRPREQTCDRIFYSWGWLGFYESPLQTQNQHSDAGVYVRQFDPASLATGAQGTDTVWIQRDIVMFGKVESSSLKEKIS